MNTPHRSQIPSYDLYRKPGERERLVTVDQSEGFFPQKKIWLSPHRKNYFLLMYITKGSGRHWVDMVPYEFKAGTLFFTTPEQVHVKEDVKSSGTVICLTNEFFAMEQMRDLIKLPFIQNIQFSNEFQLTEENRLEISGIMQHIVDEYRQVADLQDELLYTHIRMLLLTLGRIYNKQYECAALGNHHGIYRRFQSSVEDNFKKVSDAGAYARMLNISLSHLNALIRQQSGKTIMTHLHNRQILEAKRLLYNTGMSVKEIAFDLGFKDTSYFNKFFKKMTSATPLEYRTDISE